MSAKFTKVYPAIWSSARFNSLASPDAKLLLLYLMTSKHQCSAGAYHLPDGYAATDLEWPQDKYRSTRAELVEAGLILFDEENATVYICDWFKWCPAQNPKHAQAVQRMIVELPSESIAERAQEDFDRSRDPLGQAAAPQNGPSRNSPPISQSLYDSIVRTR
ncbi:hypothetical protein [Pelagibacterium montanilacus]|uniref:hypothetical protein n=1 Tax=Pelagibacterium montanilacus TaxID=2185280 RepID=UPI000F8E35A6|nr:hypothetical protein [Pelagibacterium montanilacus]